MAHEDAASTSKPRRSVWFFLGWAILVCVLILAAIAFWAWTQRYSLIEKQFISALESRGIRATLSVQYANGTQAELRDVRLHYEDKPFLSLDRLKADYNWRELREGKVETLSLTGLKASFTLDENGRPIDPWIPKGSGGETTLPRRGTFLRGADVLLRSPYGELSVRGDADILALNSITFEGHVKSSSLNYQGAELSLDGPLRASRAEDAVRFETGDMRLSATHPSFHLHQAQLSTVGSFDLSSQIATAEGRLSGGNFTSSVGLEGQIETLELNGRFNPQSGFEALMTPDLRSVTITNPERRGDLARTLSLSNALENVPIARNFSPTLTQPLDNLLGGANISGRLRLSVTETKRTVSLLSPLIVTRDNTRLTLETEADSPFYEHRTSGDHYDIKARAQLSHPIPLSLSPLELSIESSNGLSVETVRRAVGRLNSRRNWRSESPDNQAVRMGPLDLRFDYRNELESSRTLRLEGIADYDGDIPGGVVTGLKAGGTMTAQLSEDGPIVHYTPDGPVRFDRLETSSEWALEHFIGTVIGDDPIFARQADETTQVATRLTNVTVRAQRDESAESGEADVDIQLAEASLSGTIKPSLQNWDIEFGKMQAISENFPVPSTDLTLPSGTLAIQLSPTQRTEFNLVAPSSILITPSYEISDMALLARGTAEDYQLDYSNGQVKIITAPGKTPLPIMPATGALNFAGGRFTGKAITHLPRAKDQPFEVNYTLLDGRGTANINIRDLHFRPRGLQPQDLVQALRGKIAQVEGPIDADFIVNFGGGQPLSGSGQVTMKNINMGTAPGPITGMSGTVTLTSLFPVVSAPNQVLSLDQFDPGVPLLNGDFTYALVEGGVEVVSAAWPLGEGQVTIDPFTWAYTAPENRVALRVSAVEVGEFLQNIGNGRLSATGTIEGVIPVVVRGIDVRVDGGRLEVPGGGFIRFQSDPEMIDRVRNKFAADALKALENFQYDALFAEIDGPFSGEITVGMAFTGTNEDILYGVPFAFDVSLSGELFNIARSFNTNATIKSQVGRNLTISE